jgi:septal ring factor EnvC (AmiA/AmiB activator)
MTNSDLMNILTKVNQNYTQRNTIYILGGVLIFSSIGLLYLASKNQSVISNLHKTAEQNELLSMEVQQNKKLQNHLNRSIQNLIVENGFLKNNLEKFKEDLAKNKSKDIEIIS